MLEPLSEASANIRLALYLLNPLIILIIKYATNYVRYFGLALQKRNLHFSLYTL